MKHIPSYLVGMTVWIDGVGLLGTAKKMTLPKVEQMRETITAGGFARSVATGVFKEMTADYEFSEYHAGTYKAMGTTPSFVAKGSIKQKNKTFPVVITVKGGIDNDDGDWEIGKEVGQKVKQFADYFSLEINGETVVEMDAENMIANIDGVDYLADMRKHIL